MSLTGLAPAMLQGLAVLSQSPTAQQRVAAMPGTLKAPERTLHPGS